MVLCMVSQSLRIIENQKLNVPVWSLSTINEDNMSSNMNLVTYAYPVSIKPKIKWAISLYKGTLTHKNFKNNHLGVLQRLTTSHINAFDILGKRSGYTIDKIKELTDIGYELASIDLKQLNDMVITASDIYDHHHSDHDIPVIPMDTSISLSPQHEAMKIFADTPYVVYLKHGDQDPIDVGDHELFICDQIATFRYHSHQLLLSSTTDANTITTSTTHDHDDYVKNTTIISTTASTYSHNNTINNSSEMLTTSMLRALCLIP